MITDAEKCEACRRSIVEIFVEENDPIQPYRVCAACAHRLQMYALRPLEWFNLAAIHGPNTHFLHDDFYWDNGEAQQPEEDVEEAEKYPAPTLEEVSQNRERLLSSRPFNVRRFLGVENTRLSGLRPSVLRTRELRTFNEWPLRLRHDPLQIGYSNDCGTASTRQKRFTRIFAVSDESVSK